MNTEVRKNNNEGFYKDGKYYLGDPNGYYDEVIYEDDEMENLWTAACCGDIRFLEDYYKNGGKPNRRYIKFGNKHSLIMGALRQSVDMTDVIELLKRNGETILKSEVEEYKRIMTNEQYPYGSEENKYEDELVKTALNESVNDKIPFGIEFEKTIPYKMRYKQYDIIEDEETGEIYLYWITQQLFDKEELNQFVKSFMNQSFDKAYVTVRDFSYYDLKRDMENDVLVKIDKEGNISDSGYKSKCEEYDFNYEKDNFNEKKNNGIKDI